MKLFDERGLYLEVTSSDGRWWRFKYRFGGKEKRISLGVFPDVGLKDVRDRRDEARKHVAAGIDPSELRKKAKIETVEKVENTFEVVARAWLTKFSPTWIAVYAERIIHRLETDAFPWIGARPIKDVKTVELLSVLRRIESRGALETAHRILQYCGKVFRYAVATGRAERDISSGLANFGKPNGRKLISTAANGASQRSAGNECSSHRSVVTTSYRHSARTSTTHRKGRYVFPGAQHRDRVMSENTVNGALRRLGYSKGEMTGHGFRSMASTLLNEQGWNRDAIERQPAHAERDSIRAAYNYAEHLPERRTMMQAWADYLASLAAGAQFVSLHAARVT